MAEPLFTVIGGALINLGRVRYVEPSSIDPGKVIVHFDDGSTVVLDELMREVLMRLGGGKVPR
jgi:hypothetical protein